MKYLRRLMWHIARQLLMILFILSILIVVFYYAMNSANIYVLLKDGMARRAQVITMGDDASALLDYFSPACIERDKILQDVSAGGSVYTNYYSVNGIDHRLSLVSVWCWPWEDIARAVFVEDIPGVDGKLLSYRRQEASQAGLDSLPPAWQKIRYITIPSLITYEVVGLAEKPVIKIYNGLGNEVEYTPDESGNIKIDVQVGIKGEMSTDRREFALETAQMYADFLARDLGGEKYGLAKIQKRLLKGSFHYEEAKHYANDWDITFISDHVDDKPKYTNVSVSDYTEYSDECYSCRIKFTKNMILVKTKGHKEVNVDSIYYFVYADDTDDNVINPHWCMVAEESYEALTQN